MKDIWVKPATRPCGSNSGGDETLFRDRVGNTYTIMCVGERGGKQLQGSVDAMGQFMKPVVRSGEKTLRLEPVGICKYAGGVNTWVIYTDEKGQIKKIVWFNFGVKLLNPKAPANDAYWSKKQGELNAGVQKKMNDIVQKNFNDPAKAEKELRALGDKDPIDQNEKNIQVFDVSFEEIKSNLNKK
jgi:hypothetical protein